MQEQLADFLEQHEQRILSLVDGCELLLPTLGDGAPHVEESSAPPQILQHVLGDRVAFTRIRACTRSAEVCDPILRRQAEILYRLYLPYQVEPELLEGTLRSEERAREARRRFRVNLGDGPVGWHGLWTVLAHSQDLRRRRAAWRGLQQVALETAPAFLESVALRNRAARSLGFKHQLELSLTLLEIATDSLDPLLTALPPASDRPFEVMKQELDREISSFWNARSRALAPWHYLHPLRLLPPYPNEGGTGSPDREQTSALRLYLRRQGLPVAAPVLARILGTTSSSGANGKPLGAHARFWNLARRAPQVAASLGSSQADPGLPPLLRRASHPIVVEALGDLLLREMAQPRSLSSLLRISSKRADQLHDTLSQRLDRESLLTTRFAMAWHRFERELYSDPGQDLNSTWITLAGEHLRVEFRDVDKMPLWAAHPGLFDPPGLGLTRLLGLLAAAQIRGSLTAKSGEASIFAYPRSSQLLRERLLTPGASLPWSTAIAGMTGRPLVAAALLGEITS